MAGLQDEAHVAFLCRFERQTSSEDYRDYGNDDGDDGHNGYEPPELTIRS